MKFLALFFFGAAASLAAQTLPGSCPALAANATVLDLQTIRLWPSDAPQAKGRNCDDIPTLTVFAPAYDHGNGSAVIVLPGGAYMNLASNHEGRQVADWFTARGFTAFVLQYRLTSHGYVLPVPLLDARRAVQLVRARAGDYHIDPQRIVLLGFSAGGHLAALAATQPVPGNADAEDPLDRVGSRPNYLVLGYPWIGAIRANTKNLSYCTLYHLEAQCESLRLAYSPELFVSKDTPPTFWFHTTDDAVVPVEQGLLFYEALIKANVPAEAHIYAHGPHGFGLGRGNEVWEEWPNALEIWLRTQGLLTPAIAPKP